MDLTELEQWGQDDPHRYRDMFGMFLESIPSSVLFISRDLKVVFANRNFITKSRQNSAGSDRPEARTGAA